jgi:hypothetical protein
MGEKCISLSQYIAEAPGRGVRIELVSEISLSGLPQRVSNPKAVYISRTEAPNMHRGPISVGQYAQEARARDAKIILQ